MVGLFIDLLLVLLIFFIFKFSPVYVGTAIKRLFVNMAILRFSKIVVLYYVITKIISVYTEIRYSNILIAFLCDGNTPVPYSEVLSTIKKIISLIYLILLSYSISFSILYSIEIHYIIYLHVIFLFISLIILIILVFLINSYYKIFKLNILRCFYLNMFLISYFIINLLLLILAIAYSFHFFYGLFPSELMYFFYDIHEEFRNPDITFLKKCDIIKNDYFLRVKYFVRVI